VEDILPYDLTQMFCFATLFLLGPSLLVWTVNMLSSTCFMSWPLGLHTYMFMNIYELHTHIYLSIYLSLYFYVYIYTLYLHIYHYPFRFLSPSVLVLW